ncbi:MAG: DAK2 domain-containing protein [bacterium]|nr:DAK2 domain-containing protein [bacterium]
MDYKQIDTELLKQLIDAKLDIVSRFSETINFFNRFPADDVDTGNNLKETLENIKKEIEDYNSNDLKGFLKELSDAAIDQGRGWSGDIMGYYFTGMCDEMLKHTKNGVVPSSAYAVGMKQGYMTAEKHMKKHGIVEGSIITVMESAANSAVKVKSEGLKKIVEEAHRAAWHTLHTVPPKYKSEHAENQVPFDAGALGFVYMLAGCANFLGVDAKPIDLSKYKELTISQEAETKGYHAQFVVKIKNPDAIGFVEEELFDFYGEGNVEISQRGDTWNLHVHPKDPNDLITLKEYCTDVGEIIREDVDDMAKQHERMMGKSLADVANIN